MSHRETKRRRMSHRVTMMSRAMMMMVVTGCSAE